LNSTFLGHPRGLATLFFTEMWERFSYYGMRAVLVLFLVSAVSAGGFGLDDRTATAIYGLFTAGVYLAALPGGWIADRLIGARHAVLIGGVGITLGNALLATAATPRAFYLGLVAIVLGVGLLKPNVSAMVGDLYPEGGARLDSGFTIFYLGINLGAAIAPFATGGARELFGPRAGFAITAAFMAFGVLQFYATQRHLGDAGKFPAAAARGRGGAWLQLWIGSVLLALALAACSLGWVSVDALALAHASTLIIAATAALYFGFLLFAAGLSAEEKKRVLVIAVLFLGSTLFWSGYEQAGSSLNLFAERYTDRNVGDHLAIPTSWFQALNPIFVIVFSPVAAWLWIALAKRHLNPSAPAKFALGVLLMGSGFLVMAAAAYIVASGSKVLPYWLIMTYLLHTFGELCLSPVGLSYTIKLAPKRFVGQTMGMWFLSLSLGNLAAGLIAGEFRADDVRAMPGQYLHIVYFAAALGLVLLASSRPVKRWMGGVQ
jgi:POT family proton-dependent oligopeptide transporter